MKEGRLRPILGPGFGLAVALGAAIGGEILRLPGSVAQALPSPAWQLAAWTLGGLNALLGAAAFAELQTRVPRSGGLTVFAAEGLGPFAGWLVGWVDWIASAGTIGAFALLLGEIAAARWPFLRPAPVAFAAILFVGAIQWRGIRWGSLAQDVESLVKLLPLVLLAVAGCFLAAAPPEITVPVPAAGPLALFAALPLVIFAYDNYYAPAYFGEEFADPRRAVPRALFAGVGGIAAIYLLLAFAMARALPHAVLAGSELPGADLAARLLGEGGRGLLQLLMLVSLLSCMNATTLLGSRILFALGRGGRLAGRVNEGGTPAPALGFTLALACAFLLGHGFEAAVALMAPFILLNYALCFGALLRLRRRPGEGHFQAWAWIPWAALGAALALLLGSLAAAPKLAAALAGGLALAWPLYRLSRPRRS